MRKVSCSFSLTIWSDYGRSPGQRWFVWRTSWPLWGWADPSSPGNQITLRQIHAPTQGTWVTHSNIKNKRFISAVYLLCHVLIYLAFVLQNILPFLIQCCFCSSRDPEADYFMSAERRKTQRCTHRYLLFS